MNNILDLTERKEVSPLTSFEYHTYTSDPATSYEVNKLIRFTIPFQDVYTLPAESYLRVEGKFIKPANFRDSFPNHTKLAVNSVAHLFSEIRYELNGLVVDKTFLPGISTTLKTVTSQDSHTANLRGHDYFNRYTGEFTILVRLKDLLGFCEDYQKIILNAQQDLILIRDKDDRNAYVSKNPNQKLEITNITWHVPHIKVNDLERSKLEKIVKPIEISFRTWELHRLGHIDRQATKHTWTLGNFRQRPLFAMLAFQTNRSHLLTQDASVFDHCHLRNAKLYSITNHIPTRTLMSN